MPGESGMGGLEKLRRRKLQKSKNCQATKQSNTMCGARGIFGTGRGGVSVAVAAANNYCYSN